MNRRHFLTALAGAFALDPERALWTPGAKLISIPRPPTTPRYYVRVVTQYDAGRGEFINRLDCSLSPLKLPIHRNPFGPRSLVGEEFFARSLAGEDFFSLARHASQLDIPDGDLEATRHLLLASSECVTYQWRNRFVNFPGDASGVDIRELERSADLANLQRTNAD